MDLRMPRMDGIEATRRIREHPGTQVVVLTTFSDDESITGALAAGALGYLTKDAGREDIRRALEAAARGQALLDPAVHERLVQLAQRNRPPPRSGALPDGLTVREAEVLAHIGRGLSNQEIAATLFLSEATVKTHINRIFAKTHSRDRAQAIDLRSRARPHVRARQHRGPRGWARARVGSVAARRPWPRVEPRPPGGHGAAVGLVLLPNRRASAGSS